eukprot:g2678.t1
MYARIAFTSAKEASRSRIACAVAMRALEACIGRAKSCARNGAFLSGCCASENVPETLTALMSLVNVFLSSKASPPLPQSLLTDIVALSRLALVRQDVIQYREVSGAVFAFYATFAGRACSDEEDREVPLSLVASGKGNGSMLFALTVALARAPLETVPKAAEALGLFLICVGIDAVLADMSVALRVMIQHGVATDASCKTYASALRAAKPCYDAKRRTRNYANIRYVVQCTHTFAASAQRKLALDVSDFSLPGEYAFGGE